MRQPLRAGVTSAAVTALLLFLWFRIEGWLIWRSGYTDLPGQDTLHLAHSLDPYVLSLLALAGGRLSGLLSRSRRWLAAVLGVSPLLLLVSLSSHGVSFWYGVFPLLALIGAYAPTWTGKRSRTMSSQEPTAHRDT